MDLKKNTKNYSPLPAEIELILALLRPSVDEKRVACLTDRSISWETTLVFGKNNGVLPLLHCVIEKLHPAIKNRLPELLRTTCQKYYDANLFRVLHLWKQFLLAFDHLREHAIEIIPLKGIIFAQHIYSDPAMRQIAADIDALVKKENLHQAITLLQTRGYHISDQSEDNAVCLIGPNDVRFELHTEIMPAWLNRISANLLWERARAYEIDTRTLRILSPEDTLASYPLQIRFHLPQLHLFRFLDIDRMLRNNQHTLDWDYLLSRAASWGSYHSLLFSIRICYILFDSPTPPPILKLLHTRISATGLYYGLFQKQLLRSYHSPYGSKHTTSSFSSALLKIILLGNIRDCAVMLWHKINNVWHHKKNTDKKTQYNPLLQGRA